MSNKRRLGDIPYVSNYESNQIYPLDARLVVDKIENLISAEWWRTEYNRNTPIYKGMIVACNEDNNIYQYIGEDKVITSDATILMTEWKKVQSNQSPIYPLNYDADADNLQVGHYQYAVFPDWSLDVDKTFTSLEEGLYIDTKEKDGTGIYMNNRFISLGSCWSNINTSKEKRDAMSEEDNKYDVFYPENMEEYSGIYIPTSTMLDDNLYNIPLTIKGSKGVSVVTYDGNNMINMDVKDTSINTSKYSVTASKSIYQYSKYDTEIHFSSTYNLFGDSQITEGTDVESMYGEIGVSKVKNTLFDISRRFDVSVGQGVNASINLIANQEDSSINLYHRMYNNHTDSMETTSYMHIMKGDVSVWSNDITEILGKNREFLISDELYLEGKQMYFWDKEIVFPTLKEGKYVLCSNKAEGVEKGNMLWEPYSKFTHSNIESLIYHINIEAPSETPVPDVTTEKFYILGNEAYPGDTAISEVERSIVSENFYYDYQSNVFATAYYSLSDERKKTNISDIPVGNDMLKPHKFNWRDTSAVGYGFIALEVENTAYRELVAEDADGTKRVDYNGALTVCVAQLQEEIRRLKARVEWLERPYSFYN